MFSKNHKTALIQKHILAWFVYDLVIFSLNYFANPQVKIMDVFALTLIYILVFYITLFFLKYLVDKGKILHGTLAIILSFLFLFPIGYFYLVRFLPLFGIKIVIAYDFRSFLQAAILGYIGFSVYALLYFFIEKSFRKEKELRKLQQEKFDIQQKRKNEELENAILKQQHLESQREKLQFEYAFLRSQINPHFLYNTLNVLFSQALEYSLELADNIMKLSHLMRYALESVELKNGKISIKNELRYLQVLIDIYQVRFSNKLQIEYKVEGEIDQQMLPPFSIISAVENGFKYADLKDPLNPMIITITLKPGLVHIYCHNKKKSVPTVELSSHNIGFSNLQRRLDIGFKDRYEMKINDQAYFYTFELTIKN